MLTKSLTLRASAAQAGAGTVNGTEQKLQQNFSEAVVTLDVTVAATDSNDTLDVYIDTSYDGGTSWVNVGHFTQVLGNGGAKKFVMSLKSNPIATSNVVPAGTDQTAGNALQIPLGDRLRYRGVVVDPTGTNASFTYSVVAFLRK